MKHHISNIIDLRNGIASILFRTEFLTIYFHQMCNSYLFVRIYNEKDGQVNTLHKYFENVTHFLCWQLAHPYHQKKYGVEYRTHFKRNYGSSSQGVSLLRYIYVESYGAATFQG
jgi:hypothetical protein